ncbi:MAG: YeeE/YedE family protein [Alphaproteobacteria bacterium]|nr:YeeE/YedE family protein [Alphaproteobacteria bacterium]
MQRLTILVSGLIFGAGLAVSGMVNPAKVINFLDFGGPFDATLLVVFAAGVAVATLGYYLTFKRAKPLFASAFSVPTSKVIDARLVGGAAIFGIGWGITGFCPGPAMASLAYLQPVSVVFLAAMAVGTLATRLLPAKR